MSNYELNGLTLEERLLVYSWFYKLGNPLLSDQKFNYEYSKLKKDNPDSPLVQRTWSEILEPTELLIKCNLKSLSDSIMEKNKLENEFDGSIYFMPEHNMTFRNNHLQEVRDYFLQFIPKSIDTVESEQQSDEWIAQIKGDDPYIELALSLKIDGWYGDAYYYEGNYIGAFTRGRNDGESRDISKALSYVMPMRINTTEKYVAIALEAAMNKSSLEILRRMDKSREWKSHRNSMSTLLLNTLTKDFYQHIIPYGHGIKGIQFESAKAMYDFFADNGITPTPNVVLQIKETQELLNFIQTLGQMSVDIPSDGIVVRVNNTEQYNTFDTIGKYDEAIRAYRLFEWQSDIYISMVTGITHSYSAKNISLGLQVLPTKVSNGSEVSNLDADNLNRILESGVKVGSLVAFHIRSDACVDWLDFSTRYIDKCAEHNLQMDARFIKAMEKFKHSLSEKLNIDVNQAISHINSTNLLEMRED